MNIKNLPEAPKHSAEQERQRLALCPICDGYGQYEDDATLGGWRGCRSCCGKGKVTPERRAELMTEYEMEEPNAKVQGTAD